MSGSILLILRLLMALTLYIFLGLALLTLWRDLKHQSDLAAALKTPPVSLLRQAVESPTPIYFASQEILIGRDPLCDSQVDDMTVSARHARLTYHHGQWWVEDLHSTNGTFVNQEAVSIPVVVTSGDELRFGQVVFVITIGDSRSNETST